MMDRNLLFSPKDLTNEEAELLSQVRQWAEARSLNVRLSLACAGGSLNDTNIFLRYLRANKLDLEATKKHMLENVEFRSRVHVENICNMDPAKILGSSMEDLTAIFPHWHQGYDKKGHPVIYRQYGAKYDAPKMKAMTGGSFDSMMKYHCWEQEAASRLCVMQSEKLGKVVERQSGILDVKGLSLGHLNADFFAFIKVIAEVDKNQYPEVLERFVVVNAPSAFPYVWGMIKPWIDPVTVAKISVCAGPASYGPVLREFISEDQIPATYGGTGPELSQSVHPYAEYIELLSASRSRSSSSSSNSSNSSNSSSSTSRDNRSRTVSGSHYEETKEDGYIGDNERFIFGSNSMRDATTPAHTTADAAVETSAAVKMVGGNSTAVNKTTPVLNNNPVGNGAFAADDANSVCSSHVDDFSFFDVVSQASVGARGMRSGLQILATTSYRLMHGFLQLITPDKWCENVSTIQIKRGLKLAVSGFLAMSVATLILVSVSLNSMHKWNSASVNVQIWAQIIALLLSITLVVFNFIGLLGIRMNNRPVLSMYAIVLFIGTVIFAVISIACFLYYFSPGVLDYVKGHNNKVIQNYNLIIAITSLIAAVYSIFPFLLTLAYQKRLGVECSDLQMTICKQIKQMQMVMRLTQIILLGCAVAMICYIVPALLYLNHERYYSSLFEVFCIVYQAYTILIFSSFGLWASENLDSVALKPLMMFFTPAVIILMISFAVVAFVGAAGSSSLVAQHYATVHPDGNYQSELDKTQIDVHTQLLVTGIFSILVATFEVGLIVSGLLLCRLIGEKEELDRLKAEYEENGERFGEEERQETSHFYLSELEHIVGGYEKEDNGKKNDNNDKGTIAEMSSSSTMTSPIPISRDTSRASLPSDDGKVKLFERAPINNTDLCTLCWAILMGMYLIYFPSTFFIINIGNSAMQRHWLYSLWDSLGKVDSRFTTPDDYTISSSAFLAFIVGPLLLLFAFNLWQNHVASRLIGIVATTCLVMECLLYFATEIHSNFNCYHSSGAGVGLVVLVVSVTLLTYLVIPLVVLWRQCSILVELDTHVKEGDKSNNKKANKKKKRSDGRGERVDQRKEDKYESRNLLDKEDELEDDDDDDDDEGEGGGEGEGEGEGVGEGDVESGLTTKKSRNASKPTYFTVTTSRDTVTTVTETVTVCREEP